MTLVVFDIDGTLTNTKAIDDLCFLNCIRECWNCDLREVDWNYYENVTDTGLARDIYRSFRNKEISENELIELKELFSEKIISSAKENPGKFLEVKGAKEFVNELRKLDIKVAIATGGWKATAQFKLLKIGLKLEDFPYATSDDHYTRGDILKMAIVRAEEAYKTHFNKIIYIGDGLWDYKTSCELKIDFIGIDYLNNSILKDFGARTIYNDFSDKELVLSNID